MTHQFVAPGGQVSSITSVHSQLSGKFVRETISSMLKLLSIVLPKASLKRLSFFIVRQSLFSSYQNDHSNIK